MGEREPTEAQQRLLFAILPPEFASKLTTWNEIGAACRPVATGQQMTNEWSRLRKICKSLNPVWLARVTLAEEARDKQRAIGGPRALSLNAQKVLTVEQRALLKAMVTVPPAQTSPLWWEEVANASRSKRHRQMWSGIQSVPIADWCVADGVLVKKAMEAHNARSSSAPLATQICEHVIENPSACANDRAHALAATAGELLYLLAID